MTQSVVALLGVSGVGKSTLLRRLSKFLQFQHLQASALIKEGRQIVENTTVGIDTLSSADIDQNQQFLTSGFVQAVDPEAKVVILDGHSVIDTPSGLVPIDASVFSQLGINATIFLADDPTQIVLRRNGDLTRNRPVRTSDDLTKYQDIAILNAVAICRKLRVPLIVVMPTQQDYIMQLLQGLSIQPRPTLI